MKLRLRLTIPGEANPPGQLAEFELSGDAWTVSTRQLTGDAQEAMRKSGKPDITCHIADIDPSLVDDLRKTI